MRLVRVVGRAVEEVAGELVPRQPPVADELAQGVLGADTEEVVEFVDEVSGLGVVDERLGGCDEGAGAGEADASERPQAVFVEVGELVERIVAAAMGVAGSGVEVLELAERGAPADSGAERGHHVGQGGDGLLTEQGDDGVGGELGWSHCGTITAFMFRNSALFWPDCTSEPDACTCQWGELAGQGRARRLCFYRDTTAISRELFLRGS